MFQLFSVFLKLLALLDQWRPRTPSPLSLLFIPYYLPTMQLLQYVLWRITNAEAWEMRLRLAEIPSGTIAAFMELWCKPFGSRRVAQDWNLRTAIVPNSLNTGHKRELLASGIESTCARLRREAFSVIACQVRSRLTKTDRPKPATGQARDVIVVEVRPER